MTQRPKIVCLCGSTRFRRAFEDAVLAESLAGNIVLSVACYTHHDGVALTDAQKLALDELHKRKIDVADEIYVLNVAGYVGASTRSEIAYAVARNKGVRWLEPRG